MYQAIIIDDEKWVIKSLIATIADQEYFEFVGEFYDGASAFAYLREHKPDLAFIDVQLPGMSGLEILQAARQENLPTLFIVISGHAEFAYVQKALFHNAVSYCLKPFSRNELLDSLQKAYQLLESRKTSRPQEEGSSGQKEALPALESGFTPPDQMQISNKAVRSMLDYIALHYAEDISIQMLADLTCITPNYASQLFKEETGATFSSYLTNLRMYHASRLLRSTDMPIFTVANQVGYKDYFYFAKVFKRMSGHTPSAYRNMFHTPPHTERKDFPMKTHKFPPLAVLLLTCAILTQGCASYLSTDTGTQTAAPEISFGYWDIDSMQNASSPDGITQYLEDMFGFTASAQSFNWSTYRQQYQILAATDELPDVFTTVMLSSSDADDTALFHQLAASHKIQPLPDDLSDYPHLEALLSDFENLRDEDGHFYAIPHPLFSETILSSSDAALLVRRDWMDALGISDPQNIDEFISMVCAFAQQDPDGNGVDDTQGYNVNSLAALGKWVMLGIAPDCNVYSWIETSSGEYLPSWMTEEFEEVVRVYRTLYTSGGLDPDFYAKNPSAVVDDFASGRLGALEYKSSASALAELKAVWNAKNDLPFDECVDVLPIFPASDGVRYSSSSNTFWSETYISSGVSQKELDIILSLLDYLLSDAGIALYTQGIPGEDYTTAEDGIPVSLLAEEGSSHTMALLEKYPSVELWSNIANCGWDASHFEDTPLTRFLYGEDCVKLSKKALDFCREYTVQVERPYDFLTFPKEHSTYSSNAFDSFIRCIIGTQKPLAMWRDCLNDLCDQGLLDYVARQNQRYQDSLHLSS